MYIAFLIGAIAGLGGAILIAALAPTQPHLQAALERLGSTNYRAHTHTTSFKDQIGNWAYRRIPGVVPATKDLSLTETTISRFYFEKAVLAATGLIAPALLGFFLDLNGSAPWWLASAFGLILAPVMWFIPDLELKRDAANARKEYARAVAIYFELVASERKRGAVATQALLSAAEVGTSRVFVRIRQELHRAKLSGTTAWDAIAALADEVAVPELSDIARIMQLSGEQGASVYETLRGRGRSLRVQLLNDHLQEANKASERMTVPMTMLAFVFIGIVLTPMLLTML